MSQRAIQVYHNRQQNLFDQKEAAHPPDSTFATASIVEQSHDGDDSSPGYVRDTAGAANHIRPVPGFVAQEQSPVFYDSPDESDSDESMNQNVENATPPETPPQAESPGPAAAFGSLSLDNVGSDNRGQSQRGRTSTSGGHPAPSKRAASTEHPRRDRPPSPQQVVRSPRQYGPHGAKAPFRQRQPLGPKQNGSRMTLGARRGHGARAEPRTTMETWNHRSKPGQPIPKDSGYETMPSRHSTFQQPMPISCNLNENDLNSQLHAQAKEQPKGVITRLAGPVPVLIDSRYPKLIMQPESSPISQDQLAAEVKGIYGGLVMVEAKCINIDAAQAADPDSKLGPEQWQALIALHRTLLYEHHDFLMATQHPSATPALSGLAQKYSMPARMWRHGIHAFLEVLRHRRPQSQDYMLAFIYLAYQMMALLYETVPAFTDTWIECLGDLARYRMAIEEEKEAHTIWGGVAARWYNKASDRHPSIGRLYHHLGILERPSLRKMFLYAKSLSCVIPFPNARDSLATLCAPIVHDTERTNTGIAPAEATIVNYHAHLFSAPDVVTLSNLTSEILSQLSHLPSPKIKDIGVPLLVTNIAALIEQGSPSNQLWASFSQSVNASIHATRPSAAAFPTLTKSSESQPDPWPIEGTAANNAVYDFCFASFEHIMHRGKDRQSLRDVLPAVHTTLVWLHGVHAAQSNVNALDNTISSLFNRFAWGELCDFLNTLIQYDSINTRTYDWAKHRIFPGSEVEENVRPKPLSEDYLIRGLIWCHSYFPENWFSCQSEDDGRFFETPAMHKSRVERVQWLGLFLALQTNHIEFNDVEQRFKPSKQTQQSELKIIKQPYELPSGSYQSDFSPNALLSRPEGLESNKGHAEERKRASMPKSRSSTTSSARSDSEGYTIISTPKTKMSYARAATGGYVEARIVDDDHDMQFGI